MSHLKSLKLEQDIALCTWPTAVCLPMLCLPDSFISILSSSTQIKVSLQFVRRLLLMKGCTSPIEFCVLSDDLCFAQNFASPLTRSEAIIPKCTHDFTIITVPFSLPDPSCGIFACASFFFFPFLFFFILPSHQTARRPSCWWDPNHKRSKRTLFIRTRQNIHIFGVIPFVKLQNDTDSFLYVALYLDKVL